MQSGIPEMLRPVYTEMNMEHAPVSSARKTILLVSPYWKEDHRWMVSSYKLAELWQRLGYRVVVACMGAETGVEQVSETLVIHRRKDVFLKDPLNFGIAFGFAGYVRRLIKAEKPDLVIVNKVLFWTSFALIPLRLTGRRVLLLTDALVGITWKPRGMLPRIIMTCGAWTVGWLVLLCADRLVTFHPQPEKILRRLGVFRKTQVIPTGIDPAPYGPGERRMGEEDVVVTYVGRLESVKGVDDFLAAAVAVKKTMPTLKIQVAGWHAEGHPLVEQYRHDVRFLGLVTEVPKLLADTDIFVLPSYSEGLSNALMEAMASGCACVATEVGGNRFLIQNGVSGFLCPPGDREQMAAHIRRLAGDPAKRLAMGMQARARIEKTFSWEVVGKEYAALLGGLTAGR
jgi:glycosyltransferase involved in cell wall biosynthesis